MRTSFVALVMAMGLLAAPIMAAAPLPATTAIDTQQSQPVQPPTGSIDVDINADDSGAWYTSPVWIAIGVVALVLIIALIVMAGRGGGTTVVRG